MHQDHAPKPGTSGYYNYAFNWVDCSGETCIAAGIVTDTSIHGAPRIRNMFFRSTDGGETWIEQDPGLPLDYVNSQTQIHKVQQIDSLNAVGIGDSGLIVRTFDGGLSWSRQTLHTLNYIHSVHFSDPMTGIAITDRNDTGLVYACDIYTTHDGGITWTKASFSPWVFGSNCHSDGGDKFRVISYGQGPVYKTSNDWTTVDSTPLIIPLSDMTHVPGNFNFKGQDTIVGFGATGNNLDNQSVFITHSTDGGMTWDSAIVARDTLVMGSMSMSSLDRDIVFLGCQTSNQVGYSDRIGVSNDHGITWHIDTLALDTNYLASTIPSIAVTSNNEAIAAFGFGGAISQGLLARGVPETSSVSQSNNENYTRFLYPNPAVGSFNIDSVKAFRPVHILDVLGREIYQGMTSANGTLTVNVSNFPRGMYLVLLDWHGLLLSIGNLLLIAG